MEKYAASQSLWSQGGAASHQASIKLGALLSQSLWSQGGAARQFKQQAQIPMCLNPFEVREVLQAICHSCLKKSCRLNPFEVREVLQEMVLQRNALYSVSIPLKSGRCCKTLPSWSCLSRMVSIPLKSGRCCKDSVGDAGTRRRSQSLWSQGGAARVLYKTISLKSKCYLSICVKFFLTQSNFPKFCKDHVWQPLYCPHFLVFCPLHQHKRLRFPWLGCAHVLRLITLA